VVLLPGGRRRPHRRVLYGSLRAVGWIQQVPQLLRSPGVQGGSGRPCAGGSNLADRARRIGEPLDRAARTAEEEPLTLNRRPIALGGPVRCPASHDPRRTHHHHQRAALHRILDVRSQEPDAADWRSAWRSPAAAAPPSATARLRARAEAGEGDAWPLRRPAGGHSAASVDRLRGATSTSMGRVSPSRTPITRRPSRGGPRRHHHRGAGGRGAGARDQPGYRRPGAGPAGGVEGNTLQLSLGGDARAAACPVTLRQGIEWRCAPGCPRSTRWWT